MDALVLPVWDTGIANPANPLLAFARAYAAQTLRRPIRFVPTRLSGLPRRHHAWLEACGRAVAALPRPLLCAMYVYSTQVYPVVTGFLRDPRTSTRSLGVDGATHWSEHSVGLSAAYRTHGIVLYLQAKAVFTEARAARMLLRLPQGASDALRARVARAANLSSLEAYATVLPHITPFGWRKVIERFVADLDAAFGRMPPTPHALVVYRGVGTPREAETLGSDPAYLSTSLSRRTAVDFAAEGCPRCLAKITVPAGSRVLPMLTVSRYREQEVLLPRGENKRVVR